MGHAGAPIRPSGEGVAPGAPGVRVMHGLRTLARALTSWPPEADRRFPCMSVPDIAQKS